MTSKKQMLERLSELTNSGLLKFLSSTIVSEYLRIENRRSAWLFIQKEDFLQYQNNSGGMREDFLKAYWTWQNITTPLNQSDEQQ